MESDEPMCEAFARLVINTEWRRMRRASSEAAGKDEVGIV
jgi:hypothetical protein